ncbi:MAG: hypothetical protein IKV59_09335 [Lachnospiraceae bacterium]|nr:hypothetical protein [Lachnospiraceae bacterium]
MRIIPRNTKVATEFFTGVSLSDIVVGAVAILLIFFVVVSNLPYKIGICGTITVIVVLLLVRIDTESNYMFLLRIVKHFSYHRHFRKFQIDPMADFEVIDITESSNASAKAGKKKKKVKKKKEKMKIEGATQA